RLRISKRLDECTNEPSVWQRPSSEDVFKGFPNPKPHSLNSLPSFFSKDIKNFPRCSMLKEDNGLGLFKP
ncbi:hypothetical protein HAX54_025248, partial [Datura stramonium]|nr:hypothetical protein [Datura stramonium]